MGLILDCYTALQIAQAMIRLFFLMAETLVSGRTSADHTEVPESETAP